MQLFIYTEFPNYRYHFGPRTTLLHLT